MPKLSVAFTVMVSGPGVRAVRVSQRRQVGVDLAQRAADGQGRPGLDTVCRRRRSVADSTPLLSVSVTVKVSPVVSPLSDRLTPVIASPGRPRSSGRRRRRNRRHAVHRHVDRLLRGNVAEAVGRVQRDGVGVPGAVLSVSVSVPGRCSPRSASR